MIRRASGLRVRSRSRANEEDDGPTVATDFGRSRREEWADRFAGIDFVRPSAIGWSSWEGPRCRGANDDAWFTVLARGHRPRSVGSRHGLISAGSQDVAVPGSRRNCQFRGAPALSWEG